MSQSSQDKTISSDAQSGMKNTNSKAEETKHKHDHNNSNPAKPVASCYDLKKLREQPPLAPLQELPFWMNAVATGIPFILIFSVISYYFGVFVLLMSLLGYLVLGIAIFIGCTLYVESMAKMFPTKPKESHHNYITRRTSSSAKQLSTFAKLPQEVTAINPFENFSWNITIVERIRCSLTFPLLAPFRIVGILSCLIAASIFANIALAGLSKKQLTEQPLSKLRGLFLWPVQPIVRLLFFAMGFYWIPVTGKCAPRDIAPVVVPNHTSFLEPMFFAGMLLPSPVGAAEQTKRPLMGSVLRALQIIAVKRTDPDSRHAVVQTLKKRPVSKDWRRILIFPEGTCANTQALVQFKAGAFLSGAPVQPVVLRLMHTRRLDLSWVPAGPDLGFQVFRILCEPINRMHVRYLPVYTPTPEEQKNAQAYGRNVRTVMCEALGIPATNFSFLDVLMQRSALKHNIPPSESMIGVNSVIKTFNVTFDKVKGYFDQFVKLDIEHRGRVRLKEFLQAYAPKESPESPFFINLFNLLDTDKSGEIDFREFLIGLCMVGESADSSEIVKFSFHMFDLDHDGFIPKEHLVRLFTRGFPDMPKDTVHTVLKDIGHQANFEQFKQVVLSDPQFLKLFQRTFKL